MAYIYGMYQHFPISFNRQPKCDKNIELVAGKKNILDDNYIKLK